MKGQAASAPSGRAVDYSVVVPAHDEEDYLPQALRSIRAAMAEAKGFQGELIVVDNASTDATARVAACGGARVVREEHRQIARARNTGAEAARGRYLFFVDADTRISPRLLRKALGALESGKFCGGGTLIAFDRWPGPAAEFSLRIWTRLSKSRRWAAGAFLFCRRDAFLAVGGFDERLYASEEIRISQALKRWGRRNGYDLVVLDECAVTSSRKLDWFRWKDIVLAFVRLALRPSLLRSREGCRFWYDRPEKQ